MSRGVLLLLLSTTQPDLKVAPPDIIDGWEREKGFQITVEMTCTIPAFKHQGFIALHSV